MVDRDIAEEMYTANVLKLLEILTQNKQDENSIKLSARLISIASNRIMKGYYGNPGPVDEDS